MSELKVNINLNNIGITTEQLEKILDALKPKIVPKLSTKDRIKIQWGTEKRNLQSKTERR